jgi:hypothetical protein
MLSKVSLAMAESETPMRFLWQAKRAPPSRPELYPGSRGHGMNAKPLDFAACICDVNPTAGSLAPSIASRVESAVRRSHAAAAAKGSTSSVVLIPAAAGIRLGCPTAVRSRAGKAAPAVSSNQRWCPMPKRMTAATFARG